MGFNQDGEQAPLLRATHHVDDAREPAVCNAAPSRVMVIAQCLFLLAFVGIGNTLITRPIDQIQQDILCHASDMSDTAVSVTSSCVNNELSLLRSWKAAVESVMSVLTAAPFGIAADTCGRKRILQLSIAGIVLAQAFDMVICAHV
jgi:MFS family permease